MTHADDFMRWIRLVHVGEHFQCWEWRGTKPDGRYGHFSVGGKAIKAHRWIYALLNGEIADDLVVRHKCDNPACVNPGHLEIGTHADNAQDKVERGRSPDRKGEAHPMARMDEGRVRELRHMAALGHRHAFLAGKFGISRQTVGNIVRGRNWSHVQ